uniref:RNase H type-1 domain-containing protein n=1 Tax=Cannabis sativa TaxID=3483 RepID=A0A803NNB9_CANSA
MINMMVSLIDTLDGSERKDLLTYFGCIMDEIWHQRNSFCIQYQAVNVQTALLKIDQKVLELKSSFPNTQCCIVGVNEVREGQRIDERSAIGIQNYVLTYASLVQGAAGIAAISVDMTEGCWFVSSQKIQAQSVLEAKFLAILLALNRTANVGWSEVHILSDSKVAVRALTTRVIPDWRVAKVFYLSLNLSNLFHRCCFFFISRSCNGMGDGVAKYARLHSDLAVLYQGEGVSSVNPINFINE